MQGALVEPKARLDHSMLKPHEGIWRLVVDLKLKQVPIHEASILRLMWVSIVFVEVAIETEVNHVSCYWCNCVLSDGDGWTRVVMLIILVVHFSVLGDGDGWTWVVMLHGHFGSMLSDGDGSTWVVMLIILVLRFSPPETEPGCVGGGRL